jgi:chromosome segregation ATPase
MKYTLISLAMLPLIACGADYDDASSLQDPTQASTESENPYLAASELRLQELESDVADVKAELASLSAEASEKLQDLVSAMDGKRQAAAEKIAALKENGDVAWGEARESLQAALDELERLVDEVRNRIRG